MVPAKKRASRRVKASTCYKEDSSEGSASPELGDIPYRPSPEKVAADSTQDDEDRLVLCCVTDA